MMRRALPTARLPDAWLAEWGLASAEADARRRRVAGGRVGADG